MILGILKDTFSITFKISLGTFYIQALIIITMGFIFSPSEIENGNVNIVPKCKILEKTGQPCSTCGLTRGIASAAHFDFKRASTYNSFAIPIFLFEVSIIFIGTFLIFWKS